MLSEDRAECKRVLKRLTKALEAREREFRLWNQHRLDPKGQRHRHKWEMLTARIERMRATLRAYVE